VTVSTTEVASTPPDPQGSENDGPQGQPETPDPQGSTSTGDVESVKREARKWEQRARAKDDDLKALREKVKSLVSPEQVQTTEAALTQTQAALEAARLETLRYRVALQVGLPVDLAQRLVGDDEESLVKDATTLKGMVRPLKATPDAAAGTKQHPDHKVSADQALRMALGLPSPPS
jgi:hypothetical protein